MTKSNPIANLLAMYENALKGFISHSEEETHELAQFLATNWIAQGKPRVITLSGDLGVGKTTFVRGFVEACENKNGQSIRVKSPTYAYAHTYNTNPPVHHLDLYRLSSSQEGYELGLLEYLEISEGFSIIEWPEKILDELPEGSIQITISSDDPDNKNHREFKLKL